MSAAQMVARVTLKGAKSYVLNGLRWIKDVPKILKGDAVLEYQQNGYFYVHVLETKKSAKVEVEEDLDFDEVDEDDEPEEKAPSKKKHLLKKKL